MNTTVYLVRHSEPFKVHRGIEYINEDLLFMNIKMPLSVNGEKLAEEKSFNSEFSNLDVVWSSNYVRAMSTAKYFAHLNNLKVNISDKLGERIQGVSNWDELPFNFEILQLQDENYKIENGESQKEVQERMYKQLIKIVNENKGKRILIVGHATATAFLLKKWCEVNYDGDYKFNDKTFFNGKWEYLQTFKLTFDDKNNLIDIKNINFN